MDEYTKNEIKRQEIKIADVRMDIRREDIRREDRRDDIRREETRRDDIRREEIIGGFKQYPSPTMMPTRQQNPASHPFAAVPEQILTKNCLLGTWSSSPSVETYAFYDDDSFYFEGFYTGNTCIIGTYTISGSLLNLEINTNPVCKPITYIDQNTILIK